MKSHTFSSISLGASAARGAPPRPRLTAALLLLLVACRGGASSPPVDDDPDDVEDGTGGGAGQQVRRDAGARGGSGGGAGSGGSAGTGGTGGAAADGAAGGGGAAAGGGRDGGVAREDGGGARDGGALRDDGGARDGGAADCWRLPTVTRARLLPRAGQGAKLTGGRIVGSNESPTNGFVDIGAIAAAPADGQWAEVRIAAPKPYRYVKYYSPAASYGALAELELFDGEAKLAGKGFGTAGARGGGSTFDKALDGKPETFFEGPLANENYVGLDLAGNHEVAAPKATPGGGRPANPVMVTLASATAGAAIKYTTDGSDPRAGRSYTGPIAVGNGTTQIRAIATKACLYESAVTTETYVIGAPSSAVSSSLHLGNSLTDTIVDFLPEVARSGGLTLDFRRYTIEGAGIKWLWANPSGGHGEANVATLLSSRDFDHITFQPFPNGDCTPEAEARDAHSFYKLQEARNPKAQVWIYQQWPDRKFDDCVSMGAGWAMPPWNVPKKPTTWEEAVMNGLAYQEDTRAKLEALMPGRPKPLLVPGGLALVNLKKEIEAGKVPGMTDFFLSIFTKDGTDFHLSSPGRTFISMLFYTCLWKRDPRGAVSHSRSELTPAQNTAFQNIVWATAQSYPLCMQ